MKMRQYIFFMIIALCTFVAILCSSDPCSQGGSGCGSRDGETLRFVFLADSRSDSYGDPPAPANFINTPVLNAIVAQILALSPQPSFVIFGGDMAYRGHYQHSIRLFIPFKHGKTSWRP